MLTLISILLFLLSSSFLIWFFLRNDHGVKEPKGALFAAAGFGLLAVAAAAWAELLFLPDPTSRRAATLTILILSLFVGIIEELAKFGPLALFIRNKSYFNEHTDGVIYFGIAGLTFGFVENIVYLLFDSHQLGGSQLTGIFRLIVLFFFHAATTGIVGYYYAKAKIQRQSIVKPLIALGIFATIHGIYDFMFFFAASSYQRNYGLVDDNGAALIMIALVSGLIISALLNTFLFLYYRRARQWDASIGLSSDPKLVSQVSYAQPMPAQPAPVAPVQTTAPSAQVPQHRS